MFEMYGKYNKAVILTDQCEASAQAQIQAFLNHMAFEGVNIAVMPDVHNGKGAVIGFTCTLGNYIIPNLVGVDIGCSVMAIRIPVGTDFQALENYLRASIPMGTSVNEKPSKFLDASAYNDLKKVCATIGMDHQRPILAVGSLGSGNHFMEVDLAPDGSMWFVVHTGSRNFGKMVAEYHQKIASEYTMRTTGTNLKFKDMEYLPLTGPDKVLGEAYIHDMRVAQQYAALNRFEIVRRVVQFLTGDYRKANTLEKVITVHNYIDFPEDHIIPGSSSCPMDVVPTVRKGAVSARLGERLLIPINMKFGTIVAKGKGLPEYNMSAPHGAGRTMSRSQAKKTLDMGKYKKDMEGVFTTSVNRSTLDECPDAYKDPKEIMANLEGVVDVEFVMKSVYNIKDSKPDTTGEHEARI